MAVLIMILSTYNDVVTAMDTAQTDEAPWILSEKTKLELKCISARAVKKLDFLMWVWCPKYWKKYISRH